MSSTSCYTTVNRAVSEVLSSKGGRVFGKRIARKLVLIKDNIYSFAHSVTFCKYVLGASHGLTREISTGDTVMNKPGGCCLWSHGPHGLKRIFVTMMLPP